MPIPRKMRNLCRNCQKPVKRASYIYCDNACQGTHRHNIFIEQWLKRNVEGGRIGGVSQHIRRYLIETQGERCSLCGWSKINPITGKTPLEIDHIDGNYQHNAPDNVRLICANCHSLTPTFRGLNRGNGREQRRTRPLSTTVNTVVL